jgi:hypothetical protein
MHAVTNGNTYAPRAKGFATHASTTAFIILYCHYRCYRHPATARRAMLFDVITTTLLDYLSGRNRCGDRAR